LRNNQTRKPKLGIMRKQPAAKCFSENGNESTIARPKSCKLRTALSLLFIFSLFYGGLVFMPLKAQTIHLIVFANTNDPSLVLQKGMAETRDNIKTEITEVANALNLNIREAVLSGDDSNVFYLWNIIENLDPSADDIVFFFYIGHGINKPEIDSKWPQLSFAKNNHDQSKQLISFSEIIKKLEAKHPRLLIGIAEACNALDGRIEYYEDQILGLASLGYTQRDKERLKELYLLSEGTVLSSSSEPGQKSYVSSQGGYFSSAFIDAQKDLTSISDYADWTTLLEKTKLRTQTLTRLKTKNPRRQIPQYIVNVKGRQRDFKWKENFANKENIYTQQPNNFTFQHQVQTQQFLVAKFVFFADHGKVYYVMPDNYVTEYNPYSGLQVVGYRIAALQPQIFQYDLISYYNPYQFNRWGVDYQGRIMKWDQWVGWVMVGVVYY